MSVQVRSQNTRGLGLSKNSPAVNNSEDPEFARYKSPPITVRDPGHATVRQVVCPTSRLALLRGLPDQVQAWTVPSLYSAFATQRPTSVVTPDVPTNA